jgi:hypothetical protein
LRPFFVFLQGKYETIQVDDRSVAQMAQAVHKTLAPEWRDYLDTPITTEELQAAVRTRACVKAPGRDGMSGVLYGQLGEHKGGHAGRSQTECTWTVELWVHKSMVS